MKIQLGLLAAAAVSCGLPKPYTPEMLAADAAHRPERALLHYLSQPPPLALEVCDPTSEGPHLPEVDDRLVAALNEGFLRGDTPPGHWAGCTTAMWRGARLDGPIAEGVLELTTQTAADASLDPNAQALRLEAIVAVVEQRPPDARFPEGPADAAVRRWEQVLPAQPPLAQTFTTRLIDEVGLDLGRWGGEPVDAARIAALDDQAVLMRFARRLPDEALRAAAREHIVRLRIADGPWPEAKSREEEVVRAVLDTGRWALEPATWPVKGVHARDGADGPEALVVVQDLSRGDAAVLARASDGTLVPGIDLAPLLAIDVEGMSAQVALCTTTDGLDPTPCVDPIVLTATHPLVGVRDGILRLPESVPPATITALARLERIEVPVAIGESKADLAWPVAFTTPPPLVLGGQVMGANGPDLVVRVRAETTGRLVYEITRGETTQVVVVEAEQIEGFRVISQGAQGIAGSPGQPGRQGMRGADGLDAVCPYTEGTNGGYGGDGGDGGPGGAGGIGGNGGTVQVFLKCSAEAACQDLLDKVEPTVASLGGPGGPGGKGGEGGQPGEGGRGGEPTQCTHLGGEDYVDGGLDGPNGLRGDNGPDGPPGAAGQAGRISFKAVP